MRYLSILSVMLLSLAAMPAQALTPLPPPPPVTPAAMTLYVDCSAGNDRNVDCTAALPCRTIQHALARVPPKVTHAVTINVAAGTCSPTNPANYVPNGPEIGAHATIDVEGYLIDRTIDDAAGIIIRGTTSAVLPAAAVTVSTPDAVYGTQTVTVPAPAGGWRAAGVSTSYLNGGDGGLLDNGLTGLMLQVNSGTASGLVVPVISNTANTITTPYNGTDTTSVVSVRSLATTVNADPLPASGLSVIWVDNPTPKEGPQLDFGPTDGIVFDQLSFTMTGVPAYVGAAINVRNGGVTLSGSTITNDGALNSVNIQGPGSVFNAQGVQFYSSTGSAHNLALYTRFGASATISQSWLRNHYIGIQAAERANANLSFSYAQSRDGLAYSSLSGGSLLISATDIVDWAKLQTAPVFAQGPSSYAAAEGVSYTTDGGAALIACGGGAMLEVTSDNVLLGTPITPDAGAQEVSMDKGVTFIGISTINALGATTNGGLAQTNTACFTRKAY